MQKTQETWVQPLSWEDPLEEGTATHSSILAWKMPWTEEPGRLQSMGPQRVGHDWVTSLSFTFQGDSDGPRGQSTLGAVCNSQQSLWTLGNPLPPPVERVICLHSLLKAAKTLRSGALFLFCFIFFFVLRMNKKGKIQHEATSNGQHNKTAWMLFSTQRRNRLGANWDQHQKQTLATI